MISPKTLPGYVLAVRLLTNYLQIMKKNFSSHLGVVTYLFKEISTAAEFFGCGNIANDFLIDGLKLNEWFRSQDMKPYYVCVRNAGTETGFYDDVLSRCVSLGRPMKVYMIMRGNLGEFDVVTRNSL